LYTKHAHVLVFNSKEETDPEGFTEYYRFKLNVRVLYYKVNVRVFNMQKGPY